MESTYDFIIVGGGTAGCLLAHRLSHSPARPSVLLVEAGASPEADAIRAPFFRYSAPFLRPDLDYSYQSTPTKRLNDRIIPYNRGKGLGGSTLLNFQVYLYGSAEDYNRWAELVGDESWRWEHTKQSFQEIETFEFSGASAYSHLASPDPKQHGTNGTVKVSLPHILEKGVRSVMEAIERAGEKVNLDFNSGDPVGIGIMPNSSSKDGRTTSASAHLVDAPDNLAIWTNAAVHRLRFEGEKVIGIETADGRQATTKKEVIICGGSIDTPRLLLLNGIGPKSELEELGIKVVKDLPGIGKQLRDHVMAFLSMEVDGSQNDRYSFETNENMLAEAKAMWEKDKSGTFALHHGALWGGFLKLPDLEEYLEYQDLSKEWQGFLSKDTVPAYEFIGDCLLWPPGTQLAEGNTYMTAATFLMNAMSEGSITLRSADPEDKPVIDLAYLEHPYDRRIMREALRETYQKLFENPDIKKDIKRQLYGPRSFSDADIDEFLREAASTVWHMNGTVKMGRAEDALACVDSSFRVYGVEGLRVADLSVCPLTPNNHTQATAYLVGQKAADRLIAEYRLGEVQN